MGNRVEVKIIGQDDSGPAFGSAAKTMRQLSGDSREMARSGVEAGRALAGFSRIALGSLPPVVDVGLDVARSFKDVQQVSMALGASFGLVGAAAAGVVAIIKAVTEAVKEHKAAVQELQTAQELTAQNTKLFESILREIEERKKLGQIHEDEARRLFVLANQAQDLTLNANQSADALRKVAQQLVATGMTEDRIKAAKDLMAIENKMNLEMLEGDSKIRLQAGLAYEERKRQIEDLGKKSRDDVTALLELNKAVFKSEMDAIEARKAAQARKETDDIIAQLFKDDAEAEERARQTSERVLDIDRAMRLEVLTGIEQQREAERIAYEERLNEIHNTGATQEEMFRQEQDAFAAHQSNLTRIEEEQIKRRRQLQLGALDSAASILGSMASLSQSFGRKGFEAYKAFAIAQAIVSTYTGAARALADWPWPYSLVAAAAVVAQGLAQVASISAAKPAAFETGADFVPFTGPAIVHRGERIISQPQNEELIDLLGERGGGGMTEVNIFLDGQILGRGIGEMTRDGRLTIHARAVV